MAVVFLDTGVLGMVTNPRATADNEECRKWLESLLRSGVDVALAEICDYELRRELLRANKNPGIQRLDSLGTVITYVHIDTPMMRRASELWAEARRGGYPTAHGAAIDGDVILAAQALIYCRSARPLVATTNVGDLSRFVDADNWQRITVPRATA